MYRRLPFSVRRGLALLTASRFTVTVAAVIQNADGEVLLLEHVFRPGSGWGIPGGFVEPGEQPENAIRRELAEEVGIRLDSVTLIHARTVGRVRQIDILYRASTTDAPTPREFEIRSAAWFSPDCLPDTISSTQKSLIAKALLSRDDAAK